uniref:Nucleoporin NUP42 n=1 Tax=Biomphalaria glabrata TaxID=6526 RepID=A0A2C9K3Q8_BIOGL
MPVCQFFLEGRCRYGERCRNEHPRGGVQRNLFGGGGGGERKITFRDSFNNAGQNEKYKWSSSNQQYQATSQSSLDVVSNLPKEMETFESSKMWPLTCIGLEGYTKSLPDFVDTSFEELRLAAYQALKENNFKTFVSSVVKCSAVLQHSIKSRVHLVYSICQEYVKHNTIFNYSNISVHNVLVSFRSHFWMLPEHNCLKGIYYKAYINSLCQSVCPETHGSEMNTFSLFNQQKTNSAFNSLSLFSQQSPVTGSNSNVDLFSTGPNSWFSSQSAQRGGDVGSSVFGSSTAASQSTLDSATVTSSSVTNFGTPAMTLFGKPVKSLFGEENKPTTNQNIFSQPSSIFGGNAASVFNSSTASTFGGNTASTFGGNAASTFGGNAASTFGGNTASTFGGNAASTFGGNTASTFGGNAASTFGGNNTSTFGGNGIISDFVSSQTSTPLIQSSPGKPFPKATVAQASGIYSQLTDLNDQEKEAFMAKSFQLGHIPLRPPPVELIN